MKKCKNCERELENNEVDLCVACVSNKSHKTKRIIEAAGTTLALIAGIAFKFIRKK